MIGFEESYCRKWSNLTAASDGSSVLSAPGCLELAAAMPSATGGDPWHLWQSEYLTFCWWNRQLLHVKASRVLKKHIFLAKSQKKCRYNHHVPGLRVDSQLAFVHDSRLTETNCLKKHHKNCESISPSIGILRVRWPGSARGAKDLGSPEGLAVPVGMGALVVAHELFSDPGDESAQSNSVFSPSN